MKRRSGSANTVSVTNGDGHVIGVDIGATAVRATVLAPLVKDDVVTMRGSGIDRVLLPVGSVANGLILDPDSVTAALKSLWTQNKLSCKRVVLGVTNPQVVVRELRMPRLPPDQLRRALPFQARDVIALPLDQALLDFAPLGPADPIGNTVSGLLTAVPKDPVLTAVRAVEKAGLKVARVDLSSLGLLRSIGSAGQAVEALVDIGADLTTIVVHRDGIPRVVRVVARGGKELTDQIADQADITTVDAEVAKRTIGAVGDTSVAVLLRDSLRPLVSEIRSSVHFFSANNGAQVERIWLTGGSAFLPGLVELISDQVGIPVAIATPLRHVQQIEQSKHPLTADHASAVSVGLAMGAAA
jgi:type IV pilus assembly protein PilM